MAKRQHTVNEKDRPSNRVPDRQERGSLRTPAGDAFSGVAFRVLRLAGLLTSAGDELARPAGQTSARWQVLAALEHTPASVATVARALALARQSVQRVADVLEKEGLLVYDENPDHARAKLARLTPAGRHALASIQAAQRAWADRLGAALGEPDLKRAVSILDRVAAALQADEGVP
jgi:DNA-binding MarR family transcriptional regulator